MGLGSFIQAPFVLKTEDLAETVSLWGWAASPQPTFPKATDTVFAW